MNIYRSEIIPSLILILKKYLKNKERKITKKKFYRKN